MSATANPKNWIVLPSGEVLNMDFISQVQVDGNFVRLILGDNMGNGTSGSNAMVNRDEGSGAAAQALADKITAYLRTQGKLTDII